MESPGSAIHRKHTAAAVVQNTAHMHILQILALIAWLFSLIYVAFLLSLLVAAALSRSSIDPNEWYVADDLHAVVATAQQFAGDHATQPQGNSTFRAHVVVRNGYLSCTYCLDASSYCGRGGVCSGETSFLPPVFAASTEREIVMGS